MMRVASALLVAVLLTTCVISGTYAKYTTSADGGDKARVAKWGVTVKVDGSLFGKVYNDVKGGNGVSVSTTGSVVSSVTGEKVLAPGTKGEMGKITIEGTPEVKVEITCRAEVSLNGKWLAKQDSNPTTAKSYYCPLKIKIGNTELYGLDYTSEDEFKQAIEAKIKSYSKEYEANTDLSKINDISIPISWAWSYEGRSGTKVNRTDYADTYLGDQAANSNAGDIEIKVITTVTQVD